MKSKTLILTGTGLPETTIDAFDVAFGGEAAFSRAPMFDTGHNAEIEAAVQFGSGIVILHSLNQLDCACEDFLVKHRTLPTVLLAVSFDVKPVIIISKVLRNIYATLRKSDITHVRVEPVKADSNSSFQYNQGLANVLALLSQVVDQYAMAPAALFCSTQESLISYVSYETRIREEKERFSNLRNFFDVDVLVRVQRDNDDWRFTSVCFTSPRLDLTEANLTTQIQADLEHASVSDAMGLLMPMQVREVLSESLNRWLRSKKIGAICDLKLTLKCPDEATCFSIQQSPVTIEVEKLK